MLSRNDLPACSSEGGKRGKGAQVWEASERGGNGVKKGVSSKRGGGRREEKRREDLWTWSWTC
eukprot:204017-Hanusia_phi.AAC.2